MAESGRATVRRWLLVAVVDLGPSATRRNVHARIEKLFGAVMTDADRTPRVGRRGEAAWQNNVDSVYDSMKHQGEMRLSVRGDPWRISDSVVSEATRAHAEVLAAATGAAESAWAFDHDSAVDDSASLLENFRPKDAGEYRAVLEGRVMIKSRKHEATLDAYGRAMAKHGWRADTNVHPRDLELEKEGLRVLAEVKQVYNGRVTSAVREAVSQLLEYRYFFYEDAPPSLLAVFAEPVGDALTAFLDHLGIAAVWIGADETWAGNECAARGDLVPR